MKRLIGVLIMAVFCLAFSNCGKRVESVPGEPTVDTTAPVATSPSAVNYVVDNMDDGCSMGSVIGGRYYLSVYYNRHDNAFTNFRRVAASLETKGWVMVPDSFRGMYGGTFMFTGTFVPSDKRVSSEDDVPPELKLSGQ